MKLHGQSRIQPVPNVLVVSPSHNDGFIKDDLDILGRFVRAIPFTLACWGGLHQRRFWGIRGLFVIAAFIYRLFRLDVQVVIFWFVVPLYTSFMALIARILGRKVLIITGGADAVYVPDIDWGMLKSRWHRIDFGIAMRLAHSVLPFSDAAKQIIMQNYVPRHIETAYPAIDTRFFHPAPNPPGPCVVTCCYEYSAGNIRQKGLNIFVEAARRLPAIRFFIVGTATDQAAMALQRSAPPNVTFIPHIPTRAEYRDFLQTCSVYAQLSAHEGFGVSLAEAMACGCVPVVSNRYALPEVVGNCGFVVPYNDLEATVLALQKALAMDSNFRNQVRRRVAAQFDSSFRVSLFEKELGRLVPTLQIPLLRIELGCGSEPQPGTIGVDLRITASTKMVSDVRAVGLRSECADEVYSICVLEHFDNPYTVLDEIVRLLKPDGQAILRMPNLGTYSAHLDPTHRFLADLRLWKMILKGYFEQVTVIPVGTKYRDNRLLVLLTKFLVKVLGFYELAQGWTFVCRKKRAVPTHAYMGWWQENH